MFLNDDVKLELSIARRWFLDGNISRAWQHLGYAKYYFWENLKRRDLVRIGWHWSWSITWRWLFIIRLHDPAVVLGFYKFGSLIGWNTRLLDFSFKSQDNIPRDKKDSMYNKT